MEGTRLSCGPQPGTVLLCVDFRGHVAAFCFFTCSVAFLFIPSLPSFPFQTQIRLADTWAGPAPTLSLFTRSPTVWPPAKMASLIPRETFILFRETGVFLVSTRKHPWDPEGPWGGCWGGAAITNDPTHFSALLGVMQTHCL